jgi:tetratricopeptide (TPR) repeat protein
MTDLIKDERWLAYQAQSQSALEAKYFHNFQEFYQKASSQRYIPYPYSAMHACEQLLECLDDHGFIFSCDIPPLESSYCQIVGNALAHEIDNELLAEYFSGQRINTKVEIDDMVSRLILAKNPSTIPSIEASFQEHYITNNLVHRYIDLREVLIKFQYPESADVMKHVLEEFEKIAKNSPYPGIYWGNYYGMLGQTAKAIEAYKEANKHDYIKSYNLDVIIENLEKKLNSK